MKETVNYKYDLQLNAPEKVLKPESIFLNGVAPNPQKFFVYFYFFCEEIGIQN